MILHIGRNSYPVETLAKAQALYEGIRDSYFAETGEGASSFPFGKVEENGKAIARISYNGRLWEPCGDMVPLKAEGAK